MAPELQLIGGKGKTISIPIIRRKKSRWHLYCQVMQGGSFMRKQIDNVKNQNHDSSKNRGNHMGIYCHACYCILFYYDGTDHLTTIVREFRI